MMPRRIDGSVRLSVVLLLVCGVLAAAAWWQWRALQNPETASATTAKPGVESLVELPRPDTVPPPPDAFREMVDRPLFTQTRRPPEKQQVEAAQAPKPPAKMPDWKLVGTVVTEAKSHALFWDQKGRRFVRVAPGDTVEGWEVAQIEKHQVLVKQKEKQYAYLLPEF